MPNKKITLESTVSFSGLETYISCPKYFEERYINKTPYEKKIESCLIIGSWCHELIEHKIKANNQIKLRDVVEDNITYWLNIYGLSYKPEEIEKLIDVSFDLSELLYRTSIQCKDVNTAIRNKDNSVMKDPINYPSSSFLRELKNCSTYKYKGELDLIASKQKEEFIDISVVWCLADAICMADNFIIPEWVYKTIGLELGFGVDENTRFNLGEDNNTSIVGFIDWVVELDDGSIMVIDHKTSKITSKPSPLDVLYHPQLNLYAYIFEKLTGKTVNYIGINHLRSGEIIIAEVDLEVKESNYQHLLELYNHSQSGVYIRRRPTDYMSPCVKKDIKSGRVLNTCPYLHKCWPSYNDLLLKGLTYN